MPCMREVANSGADCNMHDPVDVRLSIILQLLADNAPPPPHSRSRLDGIVRKCGGSNKFHAKSASKSNHQSVFFYCDFKSCQQVCIKFGTKSRRQMWDNYVVYNYPLHWRSVCTLPCNDMRNKIVTK